MARRAVSRDSLAKVGNTAPVRAQAYPSEVSYPAVPISVLKEELLSRPGAQQVYRQRFGRAISMDRIEIAIRSASVGSMQMITDLSRETIDTDPHLAAVLNKRFGAVSSLPWEVRPASGHGIDKGRADFYAAVVREQLNMLQDFRQSLLRLAWALFDGRAALELIWRNVMGGISDPGHGTVRIALGDLGWIHPRRLNFGPFRELRVIDEKTAIGGSFVVYGLSLDEKDLKENGLWRKFATWTPQLFGEYPEREGLGPRCLYWSFFKRYSQRDRMILLELFGKPWRIVTVKEESTATGDELLEADDIADGLGAAYTARLPRGTELKVVQPGRTAGQVHKEVIDDADKQISKLVLGQTGTTDGVPAGLNSQQASVMQDEQLMVLQRDASSLSEVVEDQATDAIIEVNFGNAALTHAPKFVLRSDLPVDRNSELDRVKKALDNGMELSRAEAYEVSGFRIPERDEAIIRMDQPPTPANAPVSPPPRPVIVWPPAQSPPAGEQNPAAPVAGPADGGAGGSGVSVGSADQGATITVNESREAQGLGPLLNPDGSENPDGKLTVEEFKAKQTAAVPPDGVEPEAVAEIAKQALNGAQINAVLLIVEQYKSGALEFESAMELLTISFPFSAEQAKKILGSVAKSAPPTEPEPGGTDGGATPPPGGGEPEPPAEPAAPPATPPEGAEAALQPSDVHDPSELVVDVTATIKEEGGKWVIYNEDGTQKLGEYDTKEEAEERLKEIERLKHVDSEQRRMLLTLARSEADFKAELSRLHSIGPGHSCSICLGRQPDTTFGSPEDLLDRGINELQRAVRAWAAAYENAVEGEANPLAIFNTINRTTERLDMLPFSRALERRIVHGLALGALDSNFEMEEDVVIDQPALTPPNPIAPELRRIALQDVKPNFSKMNFTEALKYFKDQNVVSRAEFDRLSAVAKQKAFNVAAATSDQMLRAIHAELTVQIGAGADMRQFGKFLRNKLTTEGFTTVGAISAKQRAAYVDNVFRTNVLGSYNKGRAAQMSQPEVMRARPLWQIRTVKDDRRRINHGRADSLVLRASDPFWQRAYPPWGFNCRCRIVSRTAVWAEKTGTTITAGTTIDYLPDPGFTSGIAALL